MAESLTLKWGTIKAYSGLSDKSRKIIERFFADDYPMSCMLDKPDDARKEILCELIDQLDSETIYLDWDAKDVSKEEAKKYVREYGQHA
jgi:hypothetical protein